MNVPKLFVFAIMLALGLGPLLYGLQSHNWDVVSLVTPKYTPPRIDFDVKYADINVNNEAVTIALLIENKGEVAVILQDVNAALYGPDGAEVGRLQIKNPLRIRPGERGQLNMSLSTTLLALKLVPYFTTSREITLSARGAISVKILGTEALVPLAMELKLSIEQLGISPEKVSINIDRTLRTNNVLKFILRAFNPTWWEAVIEYVEAKLYSSNGTEILPLTLERAVEIKPGTSGELALVARLDEVVIAKLAQYVAAGETFTIKGKARVSILSLHYELSLEYKVAITREQLGI